MKLLARGGEMWRGHGASSAFWDIPQCSGWQLLWSHLNIMGVLAMSAGQDLPLFPCAKAFLKQK